MIKAPIRWRLNRDARLIDALKEHINEPISLRRLKRALEGNGCRINGVIERFASARVKKGDCIELSSNWDLSLSSVKSFPILYQDEEIFAINKPTNSICTETYFRKVLKKNLHLAHRLDKDTTGVLLFAKTSQGVEVLHQMFQERKVHKEYLAWVDGIPKAKEGNIISYLSRKGCYQGQTIWGSDLSKEGLFAETAWECIEIREKIALLRCFPKTGRTHQIRVHLAEMGHPILTDRQYAKNFRSKTCATRPLLHAHKLQFNWKGKAIAIEAPLPDDFFF